MPDTPAEEAPDPLAVMRGRGFIALLALAAVVGLVVSLVAWVFLEAVHLLQVGVYDDLPGTLGFDQRPIWWSLPVMALAGLVVAWAINALPGKGGHVPAEGLNPSPVQPSALPGVVIAAAAGIGLGIVLGPEAPLIALGGALGIYAVRSLRSDAPDTVSTLVGSSGAFAAVSFLFGSPLIAAVLLIEAAGIGGAQLALVLIPGLVAAGIGSLVQIGMGSWTGVDTSDISLDLLPMPAFDRPDLADFLWTVPLAVAIAIGVILILDLGRAVLPRAEARPYLVVPAIGAAVAGLAILFHAVTDKGVEQVLFSGQETIGPLIENAGSWSLGALALLIACKGLAYGLALGSFRGGPVFPAMLLGAAAGLMAAELPGLDLTPAVAVGIGAAVVAVLRLPLAAVVLATLLTSQGGVGAGPLVIVGVAAAYLASLELDRRAGSEPAPAGDRGASTGAAG